MDCIVKQKILFYIFLISTGLKAALGQYESFLPYFRINVLNRINAYQICCNYYSLNYQPQIWKEAIMIWAYHVRQIHTNEK